MTYHYVESGLDNVWLGNGYTFHQTPYGEGVSVDDMSGLHKAISQWLINTPKRLNGADLRFLRLEMDLTQKDLAGILGADEQALRRWEKNRNKSINGSADHLLRLVAKEYIHGDGEVRRMIDRLASFNALEDTSVVFRETGGGWQPENYFLNNEN